MSADKSESSITLATDILSATVLPSHGGLISELVVNSAQVNLLWERSPPRHQALAGSYDPGGVDCFDDAVFSGGWFAMFPIAGIPGTIDPQLMHGELARVPWTIAHRTSTSVTMVVTTTNPQFDVSRTVHLVDDQIFVVTTARNLSGFESAITFGEHPCLARSVFAGGEITAEVVASSVPAGVSDSAAISYEPGQDFDWPWVRKLNGILADASRVPTVADGRHDHITVGLGSAEFSISAPSLQGSLKFSVDLDELSHVLYWQHYQPAQSPWNGDVFALEAASAPGRTTDEARESCSVSRVLPNASISWRMSARWTAWSTSKRFTAAGS